MADPDIGTIASIYKVPSYITYITENKPIAGSFPYLFDGGSYTIIGMEYDNYQYGYQKAFSAGGEKYRTKINGVWSEWEDNVTNSDLEGNFYIRCYQGLLNTDNQNLNNLTTQGIYLCDYLNSDITNSPITSNYFNGALFVLRAGNFICQIYIGSQILAYRINFYGSWGGWITLSKYL